jgi:3-oxoadipate enol-lactonase
MPFAVTSNARLHYTISGEGEHTLLLLMGLGGHASEWGEPFLSRLRPHYRVVCMDNRGIGQSESRVDQWTLEDMAHDALAVLAATGCERGFVAGTSMGGMIAQLVALLGPSHVERLALMSTHFGGPDSLPPTERAASVFVPQAGASQGEVQRRSMRILTASGFADRHPEIIDALAALREREVTRARVFRAQFGAIVAGDRSQAVRSLRLPTLIIHGLDDGLVPVDNGRSLAERIPGAELVLLEACGHFPHIEKPEQCASALIRFLS